MGIREQELDDRIPRRPEHELTPGSSPHCLLVGAQWPDGLGRPVVDQAVRVTIGVEAVRSNCVRVR